jgi:preprotein translocase subunit Sss1
MFRQYLAFLKQRQQPKNEEYIHIAENTVAAWRR